MSDNERDAPFVPEDADTTTPPVSDTLGGEGSGLRDEIAGADEADPVVASDEAAADNGEGNALATLPAPTSAKPIQAAMAALFEEPERKRHRLGEWLIERNLITRQVLEAASMEQEVTGERIGQILVANGFLADRDRVQAILAVSSERIAQENVSSSRIPAELLDEHSIIVSTVTETEIYLSTMSDEDEVARIVAEYYPDKRAVFVAFLPTNMADFVSKMKRTADIKDASLSHDTMLDRILYRGLGEGASDIHIMPRRKSYTVMFRLLGVRRIVHEGPLDEYLTMVAQIKDRSRMDLAERKKPQDGGFQIEHSSKMIDLRVATLPTSQGETCVIRILDPDRVQPSLVKLGISRVDLWRKGFNQQHGLCLICGPTGSGKTTTLNASIREINRFEKAVYTIEDPVEYQIAYAGQMSTNTAVGLDFARGVRAFMRADPDVIVLGEVRDEETARNAVKAADTGHLVVATLHTGSIVGAVSRLRDLGIDPKELRYLLRAVLVQTLVRVKCGHCHGEGMVGGVRCAACKGTGYSGRTVVSECAQFPTISDVERVIAGESWWPSMAEDAVSKFRDGITTRKEIGRVFGSAADPFLEEHEL